MVELREQLQSTLGSAYAIDRELAPGGMSRVFVAKETTLERHVVVKVLPPHLAGGVDNERFRREIQVAAKLLHPHILPLLSAGDSKGLPFYTMPFVEGESLRSHLATRGPLPIDEAIQLTCDIAGALDYAHRQGVVHRDIKPDNILLHDGRAMVTDFGIARAVSQSTNATTLTQVGVALGTPAYMSPEQAMGEGEVDGRADVYSLGCLFYELIAGVPPYVASTPQALFAKHIREPVPAVRSVRADVPESVESALFKALAKAPNDRFASAAQFAAALQNRTAARAAEAPRADVSIAVLPFVNMSADPETEYFSDGVTEEILNALTLIDGIRVVARTSTFALKGANRDMREIGRTLGVSSVLEGTVRRAGARLRVTAQLVETATGYQMWSERFDRELVDVFAIQDEIAQAIATRLSAHQRPKLAAERRPANLAAYDAYQRGMFFLHKWADTWLRRAIEQFNEAIQLDPAYALAYAGRAYTWIELTNGVGIEAPRDGMQRAREDTERALTLDQNLPEAHFADGMIAMYGDYDWRRAERAYGRALQLRPNYVAVYHWRGYSRMWLEGNFEGALEDYTNAVKLDPLNLVIYPQSSYAYHLLGRWEDALRVCDEGLALEPNFGFGHFSRGAALLTLDRLDESIAALEEAIRLDGRLVNELSVLAWAHGKKGDQASARAIIAELEGRASRGHVAAYWIGLANVSTDRDKVFEWFNRAWDERDPSIMYIRYSGYTLSSDPRYLALLKRMGLEYVWTNGHR